MIKSLAFSRMAALGVAVAVLASVSDAAAQEATCWDGVSGPRADADLYCLVLVPTPDLMAATGTVRMARSPSPFGATVTPDGRPQFAITIDIAGLPDPSTLGPYTTYVAWVTTPVLDPMVKLGAVGNGSTAAGHVEFDKFMVLISAENSADVERRDGRLVLRGMSPSMRMLPDQHMMVAPAVRDDAANSGDQRWFVPPMHPAVPMMWALRGLRPRTAPFLPDTVGRRIVDARPRQLLRLDDGDTLDLEAVMVRRNVLGREFIMYGFNAQYPGPLIEVSQGATIVVNFTNHIDLPTTVHWHGLRLDNRFDGVPGVTQDAVMPDETFRYQVYFPDAGIYWYHPHHREDIQQDLGLYGNMLVRSSDPGFFNPVNREEVLMLDDLLVGADGLVPFGRDRATHTLMGRFGNVVLVNGEPTYELEVGRGEVVRFFLTNVSNTRTFNVSFGGAAVKVVGSDVGKFEREAWVESVVIAPAERFIVEVRFDTPGVATVTNRVQGLNHFFGTFFAEVDTLGLIAVGADPPAEDFAAEFNRLRQHDDVIAGIDPYRPFFDRPVDYHLVLQLATHDLPVSVDWMMRLDSIYFSPVEWTGTMPIMNWVSTSAEVRWILRDPTSGNENMDVQWRFTVGDVVKVRLTNDRHSLHAMQHPIHIHGQRFLVLEQDGARNNNLVWKDTILLPVGSTADILLELTNPGRWMVHCHIAEHLEAGMRMVFEVVEDGS
ncbi:MAG: multicopper oxidase family protein [Gemmatimonadetes bacterium]|nr:multicopper oxidase family protein [Gemmatimonadota bacterium]